MRRRDFIVVLGGVLKGPPHPFSLQLAPQAV